MSKKICYIVSDVNKALAFEWHALELRKKGLEISFILLNCDDSEMEKFLRNNQFIHTRIHYKTKKNLLAAIYKTSRFLLQNKIEVISVHLIDAGLIGLFSGFICGIKKRVYTRHHSTYHHEYAKRGILIDKLLNKLATDVIAISENVRNVLIKMEGLSTNKIHLVHHGFLLESFQNVSHERVNALKIKFNLSHDNYPVIGVVARYFKLKGIQYTISSFKTILNSYPNARLILCGAFGVDKEYIKTCLKELPPRSYNEIPFEVDNFALYQLFDVFVHVPDNKNCEAFGQIYVESLAAGVPSVFTLSGVAPEFIIDGYNALVVDYKNSEEISQSVLRILIDESLRETLKKNGPISLSKHFELTKMINKLCVIYTS